MTTRAQRKRLIRPLLEKHADLAMVGDWIFVRPVEHFVRAILFGPAPDPRESQLRWAVMHLLEPADDIHLSWGGYVFDASSPIPPNYPDLSESEMSELVIGEIERTTLPKLRAMKTFHDFVAHVSENAFRHHLFDEPSAKVLIDVAFGELDSARALCGGWIGRWSVDSPAHREHAKTLRRRLRVLCACLADDDRHALARLLHEWEEQTVRNLKIEHLWQPTPFPLESPGMAG